MQKESESLFGKDAGRCKRHAAGAVLLLLIVAHALIGSGCRRLQPKAAPSILVVLMDDARPEAVPWLDTLAAEGVYFTDAHATHPHCGPSRANLLSGRTGTVDVNGTLAGFDATDTIGVRIQRAGYASGFFGKYINGYEAANGIPPGWDRWLAFDGLPHYLNFTAVDETGRLQSPPAYSADWFAAQVSAWLRSQAGPAFAIWAPYAPHVEASDALEILPPVPAPRHLNSLAGLAPWRPLNYDTTPSNAPAWMKRLRNSGDTDVIRLRGMEATLAVKEAIDALRAENPDLIVFVTSDNGVGWGDHRLHRQAKCCPHVHCTRIPLVALGPWTPRLVRQPVILEDLTATALALARADTSGLDGRDLEPLLETGFSREWRVRVPLRYGGTTFPVDRPIWDGVYDSEARTLAVEYATGEREFYDLTSDPGMLTNLPPD